jgi:hypothetical protein
MRAGWDGVKVGVPASVAFRPSSVTTAEASSPKWAARLTSEMGRDGVLRHRADVTPDRACSLDEQVAHMTAALDWLQSLEGIAWRADFADAALRAEAVAS